MGEAEEEHRNYCEQVAVSKAEGHNQDEYIGSWGLDWSVLDIFSTVPTGSQ